jgi:proline racemase
VVLQISRLISVIDTHTEGEPTRIITGGIPPLLGRSIAEKREYFKLHYDELRKLLMLEPRGHDNMFGALLVEPTSPNAHLGVIFMDTYGYLNMCGHGSMAVATVAIETGLIPHHHSKSPIILDTPAGLVYIMPELDKGKVQSVTLKNVPAFLVHQDFAIQPPNMDSIVLDIAFGGNFFGIIHSNLFGGIYHDRLDNLVSTGMQILKMLRQIPIQHPTERHINKIDLIEFSGAPSTSKADTCNLAVFGNRQVDRSPCGTGTSAKMAALYARGELKLNEEYCAESILGTHFIGKLVEEVKVGDYAAVIPLITGSAHVIALSQIILDPRDPFTSGFHVEMG